MQYLQECCKGNRSSIKLPGVNAISTIPKNPKARNNKNKMVNDRHNLLALVMAVFSLITMAAAIPVMEVICHVFSLFDS